MALGMSTTVRNNMLDAITAQAGASAKLRFYDGTRPAATGGTATTLLAELICNATAFAPAASTGIGGVLTLNAITSATASASGTATWFRIVTSGGTFVLDGNVGTSGSDLNMSAVVFSSGATIAVSAYTITAGNA
jgi:hypothetical protein